MTAATDGLCIHELDLRTCVDCAAGPRHTDPATVTAIASFQSRCPACDEPVLAAELITLTDDDVWIHHRCLQETTR